MWWEGDFEMGNAHQMDFNSSLASGVGFSMMWTRDEAIE
jgi:hypothetical protein